MATKEEKMAVITKVLDLVTKAQDWEESQKELKENKSKPKWMLILTKAKILSIKYYKLLKAPVLIIFAILLLTNPTRKDFASFQHWEGERHIGRESNYFIASIYSNYAYSEKVRYFGILGNFYVIRPN